MNQKLNSFKLAGAGLVSLAIAACGDSTKVDTEVGSFMKGQAGGVIYMTESRTGMTDQNGAFLYEPGENVSFYIGGTKLGATVPAASNVGPMDLVAGVTIPVTPLETSKFLDLQYDSFGTEQQADLRHELLNILMYLYSADKDKDSTNGIMLDPAFHDEFAQSYDLKIRASRFDNIEGFERKFYQAYAAGVVDSARLINRHKAMDDFAKLQGLSPQVAVIAYEYYDRRADGEIDRVTEFLLDGETGLYGGYIEDEYVEYYHFNQYGDELGYEEDDESDGIIDNSKVNTYDIHGNRLSRVYFNDDGSIRSNYTYVYNQFGQIVEENDDDNADGVWDERELSYYDDRGNKIRYEEDEDGDGNLDYIEYWQFDADNNEIYYAEDEDGDGHLDAAREYTYNSDGRIIEEKYDNDGDGTYDTAHLYEYNAAGQHTLHSYDQDNDGVIDSTFEFVYENGLLIETRDDADADSVIDHVSYYEYDSEGREILYQFDRNADGVFDSVYTREYDDNGNQVYQSFDWDGDGELDSEYFSEFDQNSNQTRRAYDWDGDGELDSITEYEYDVDGNRTRNASDHNGDGTPDRIYTYDYIYAGFLAYNTWD